MADPKDGLCTLTSLDRDRSLRLPSVLVSVTRANEGPAQARLGMAPVLVGTGSDCDLVLADPQVSRRHCELRLTKRGVLLRDLGSKNGTMIGRVPVLEAVLPTAVPVTIGGSELVVHEIGAPSILPLSSAGRFGAALGQSLVMRALFAKLERAAPSEQTILLLGESGTGKEVLARAIHEHGPRPDGPFVVVDCGASASNLVESELFGHVRGAFTGASSTHAGLLEEASGGTLFIDEIGELPLELQPKLLRALEARQIRRVGSNEWRSFDARIVAATHRNLRARVAAGSFREDLFYRLAVVEVHVPALRERKDDLPLLIESFLRAQVPPRTLGDLPPHALSLLEAHDWPGNVRELRNLVARLTLFPELIEELIGAPHTPEQPARAPSPVALAGPPAPAPDRLAPLMDLPLAQAREMLLEQFERGYLTLKLKQHGGNISRVADAIGATRPLVYRLMDRYGIRAR